ncbi:class I SAM-dependent methyltransferase [Capillimicrobium parvum]|uniref:Ubiquinone biosynthesis O-methyltransferase, mitochondrial n=1 Tax=Capillimicrobium parvum TaxID=2884022 RepID=A0A9E6Y157_9ACTN|nr:methyltransferase domain-containing protein [Capillimicrobium parvum]UGS37863.1 Ubiquinone biosynthesis O-methyltransferase, mitochondrial [Capillimicrobium parvum]
MEERFYAEYFEIEDRHWWFLGRRRIILSELARALAPAPGGTRRLLDVGCGTGTMVRELGRFGRAEGLDADPQAVAFCAKRGLTSVARLEGGRLPHEDASLDVVSAFDVLEHLDDDAGMAAEMRRVLRPGGTAIVTVPAYRWMWGPQDEISHHRRRYVRRELVALLRGAGLDVRRATYFNTLLFGPIAAVRVLRRDRGGGELRSDFELGSPRMNRLLAGAFGSEEALLRRGVSFPFGVSILAIGQAGADQVR